MYYSIFMRDFPDGDWTFYGITIKIYENILQEKFSCHFTVN